MTKKKLDPRQFQQSSRSTISPPENGPLLENTQLRLVRKEIDGYDPILLSYVQKTNSDKHDDLPHSPALFQPDVEAAPDGGYGWVIVAAAFLCSFIVDGVANSFGLYIIEFKALYPEEPESFISWIGSLLVGVYLCMGPIACGLAETFGYRIIITSGSVIAAVGFFSSVFVTHIHILFLTFGVVGGIGFGLIYAPSIMCVCCYFKEKSALAVGIAVCGSSVGGMVCPLLVQYILEFYGWRGSMLFLAGAALQCCLAGALMRTPPKPKAVCTEPDGEPSCLPPLLRQALVDMTNVKVYSNPTFLAYSLASFIGSIAFLTPFFFLPAFAVEAFEPLSKETATVTITAVCGAGIFGRIIFGWLADHPKFDALGVHNVCIFISGVALLLVPVCGSFTLLLVIGAVYGFFIAPYISLMSTILSSRLGLEQLPNAFGQTQLIAGIASIAGPPLHSELDETFNNQVPFYFAGGAWILASLIASLIFLFPKKKSQNPQFVASQQTDQEMGEPVDVLIA